jgi:hypothetical protein
LGGVSRGTAEGRGLVWALGRGARPGLLADPGSPSHPPAFRTFNRATVCADKLVGSRSRAEAQEALLWLGQHKSTTGYVVLTVTSACPP